MSRTDGDTMETDDNNIVTLNELNVRVAGYVDSRKHTYNRSTTDFDLSVRRFCSTLQEVASSRNVSDDLLLYLADRRCFDDLFFTRVTVGRSKRLGFGDFQHNAGEQGLGVNMFDIVQRTILVHYIVENLTESKIYSEHLWKDFVFISEENHFFMSNYVHSMKHPHIPRHAMALVYALNTLEEVAVVIRKLSENHIIRRICTGTTFGVQVFNAFKASYTSDKTKTYTVGLHNDELNFGMTNVIDALKAVCEITNDCATTLSPDDFADGSSHTVRNEFEKFFTKIVLHRSALSWRSDDFYEDEPDSLVKFIVDWSTFVNTNMPRVRTVLLKDDINDHYIDNTCRPYLRNVDLWKRFLLDYKKILIAQFNEMMSNESCYDTETNIIDSIVVQLLTGFLDVSQIQEQPHKEVIELKYGEKKRDMLNFVRELVIEAASQNRVVYDETVARYYMEIE